MKTHIERKAAFAVSSHDRILELIADSLEEDDLLKQAAKQANAFPVENREQRLLEKRNNIFFIFCYQMS